MHWEIPQKPNWSQAGVEVPGCEARTLHGSMKNTVRAIVEEQKWATVAAATLCTMDAAV